jgi:hypothetical protein
VVVIDFFFFAPEGAIDGGAALAALGMTFELGATGKPN